MPRGSGALSSGRADQSKQEEQWAVEIEWRGRLAGVKELQKLL